MTSTRRLGFSVGSYINEWRTKVRLLRQILELLITISTSWIAFSVIQIYSQSSKSYQAYQRYSIHLRKNVTHLLVEFSRLRAIPDQYCIYAIKNKDTVSLYRFLTVYDLIVPRSQFDYSQTVDLRRNSPYATQISGVRLWTRLHINTGWTR